MATPANCDPETLIEQAACLDCLSQAQLDAVEVYLLCLWAFNLN